MLVGIRMNRFGALQVNVLRIFVLLAIAIALPVSIASAQSASDGQRTLTASKSTGLDPAGEVVQVAGSGYDVEKGIYVAFCVMPALGQMPTPCGGGIDLSGSSGSSGWISSNPPSYGVGLAQPYGEGGTFSVPLAVSPVIDASHDCRVIQCAIVTRSDHTRLSDRSQDVLIPVTFASAEPPPTPVTPAPAVPTATPVQGAQPTPVPPTPTAVPSPSPSPAATSASPTPALPPLTFSPDGTSATRGDASIAVTKSQQIDPAGERISVKGHGFDDGHGLYVALCAIPADGKAPGPCASGSTDTSAWISSNPPDYAKDRARAYGNGGNFEVELLIEPVIDASTDCRQVACGITTRSDDTAASDRSYDLFVPVSFAAASSANTPTAGAADTSGSGSGDASAASDGGGSSAGWIWAGAGTVIVLAAAGGGLLLMRRRHGAAVAGLSILVLLLGACSGSSQAAGDTAATATAGAHLPVTVQSADGRDVVVKDTSRIVSLWGNLTEVVVGLGLTDNLVGRDVASTIPEVADLPIVTRAHDVSAEGVLSLNPTLVIGSMDNSGPATAIAQIRNVGVPVILFEDPTSVDDIVPRIRAIATALGVPEAGERMAAETGADLAAVEARIPDSAQKPLVAFLYMRGQAGVYLIAGPGSGADSMIEAAGGIDAGTHMGLENPFTPITSEALVKAAPDVILLMTGGLESVGGIDGLVKIPGIAQTPAGKARRIVTIDDELLYSFGPRTPEALETLSQEFLAALSKSP